MDRTLSVHTPESITFSYELAGLGSRFLAVFLDLIVQGLIAAAIFWGFALAASYVHGVLRIFTGPKFAQSLAIALVVIVLFAIFFGYFILFEAFNNGRTPGKQLMGLRVVRDGGYPLDFASAAVRNLIRIGEVAVGFYAISAIACLASPENKRLGDMVAGTIVVRDSPAASLAKLVEQSQEDAGSTMLSEKELALIDQFVARRASLAPSVRVQIAARIAAQVRPRVSPDLRGLSNDELLTRISAS